MKWPKIDIPGATQDKLGRAIETGHLAHCILLTGATADIRKKTAYIIAQAILCTAEKNIPCGKCTQCKKVKEKIHSDVRIAEVPEGKKFIPVDLIKELVIANANIVPGDGKFNIFIIHEASDLREEAANALLKTIEEPPEFSIFILTAGSRAAVLPTILSRSEEFSLGEERDSISGVTAKKVEEIALEIGRGLYKCDERAVMLATSPLTKNRVLTGRVCDKLKTVVRDALSHGSEEKISGMDAMADSFRKKFSPAVLLSMTDVLNSLLDDTEISCNENLLLCSLSVKLTAAARGENTKW